MAKDPREMDIEELDQVYGKPREEQMVNAVLAVEWNDNHDLVIFEMATIKKERLRLPITQKALKELVTIAGGQINRPERPKLN